MTLTPIQHAKILGIGFGAFAAILFFTFMLLLLVTVGVLVALGITIANETGDPNQAGIGVLGGIFTIVFYGVLGLVGVVPTGLASWKLLKQKPGARIWGIIASIVLLPVLPAGTALGIYGFWFFFTDRGRSCIS